ncbi:hypothetical protein [Streptomyces bicolor]|uniref:hypothetical protein n=1 Tax=Streptomyces bicolor TaxID=66874 RepID=UPI001F1E83DF|nr:hypothetical protein [Streptomyces bicolor]
MRRLPPCGGGYRGEEALGSGAGVVGLVVFFFYVLLMGPFCVLIGSRTSSGMGWLMSVPLIFLPLAWLVGLAIP